MRRYLLRSVIVVDCLRSIIIRVRIVVLLPADKIKNDCLSHVYTTGVVYFFGE